MTGRIRTIKPEWLEDEKIVMATSSARVLSIAAILMADDYGNGRIVHQVMSCRVFPREPEVFAASLRELCDIGFLVVYVVDGQTYYHIRTWDKHQRIDNAGKPRCPGYLDSLAEVCGEIPRLAEVRGLTPTPTPTKTRRSSPKSSQLKNTSPDPTSLLAAHRSRLLDLRKIEYPQPTAHEKKTAIALIAVWGVDADACVRSYVETNNKFYERTKWPLGVALRNASEIWAGWKNNSSSSANASKSDDLEAHYARQRAEVERMNQEEDDMLSRQGELL